MPRQDKRRVKRQTASGRQAVVSQYGQRSWYQLPDWARAWIFDNAGWVVLVFAIILAPPALLALVLGLHALPLEFFGVPSNANGVGLAAIVLLAKFIFVALSVRPLLRQEQRGWHYLLVAATVHFVHSIILQHAITGAFILGLTIYLYWQVRYRYAT